jgi:hypothetical protein
MPSWEYCAVRVAATYDEGSGGGPIELLSIKLPSTKWTAKSNTYGLIGLLNELGTQGWELVDVEAQTFYLKRPATSAS